MHVGEWVVFNKTYDQTFVACNSMNVRFLLFLLLLLSLLIPYQYDSGINIL